MSNTANYNNLAYAVNQPTLQTPPMAIISNRAPTVNDRATPGQAWIFGNALYILTSNKNNISTWLLVESGGGTGVFASLEATTGNITADLGNIIATDGNIEAIAGDITAGTTITAGTGITSTIGDIVASAGDITATIGDVSAGATIEAGTTITAGTGITSTAGAITASSGKVIAGTTLQANGDAAGATSTTSFSNVTDTTQGAGALTILNPTGTSHTNTGLFKIYIGTTEAWVPYFVTIT